MKDTLISFPQSLITALGEGAAADLQILMQDIEKSYVKAEVDEAYRRFLRVILMVMGCSLAFAVVVLMLFVAMFLVFK
jgi:hypothetical protein